MKRILIIEDESAVVDALRVTLAREGFQVTSKADGLTGLAQVRKTPPDLLILDLILPQFSGLDVCREIRRDEKLSRLPILVVTGRDEEADRIVGLELGADDYVTKPFSTRELAARVKALLRRTEPEGETKKRLEVGDLIIDPASHRVTRSGKPVPLTTLEFRLLYFLASHPNRLFSRDQLLDAAWGEDRFVSPRSVDTYLWRLRKKVESGSRSPLHLKTVRGAGYIFQTGAN